MLKTPKTSATFDTPVLARLRCNFSLLVVTASEKVPPKSDSEPVKINHLRGKRRCLELRFCQRF